MTIYDMFMNCGGAPLAEEERSYAIWGTPAYVKRAKKAAPKGGILKKNTDWESKYKGEEEHSPESSVISAFSKRRRKVQFSFKESEGIEEEQEYNDFDALEDIKESDEEGEEMSKDKDEDEKEDDEEDPDEISDDNDMAFDNSKLSNVSFDMIE